MKNRHGVNVLIVREEIRETLINALSPKLIPRLQSDESLPSVRADQAWFNANPNRKHYVRPSMEGDVLMGDVDRVIARREKGGFRHAPVPQEYDYPDAEEYAAVMYEMSRQILDKMAAGKVRVEDGFIVFDVDEYCELVALQRAFKWVP